MKEKHGIVKGLTALKTSMKKMKLDPDNPRLHEDESIDSIAVSLRQFGQRKPIVVNRKTKYIEAGNGTYQAAKKLKWTHIAAVFVEDVTATATGYQIADNRVAELSKWDWQQVLESMKDLQKHKINLSITGFKRVEIEPLLAATWPTETPKLLTPLTIVLTSAEVVAIDALCEGVEGKAREGRIARKGEEACVERYKEVVRHRFLAER